MAMALSISSSAEQSSPNRTQLSVYPEEDLVKHMILDIWMEQKILYKWLMW